MEATNVQNKILNEAKKSKVLVTIYLIHGSQIKGTITDFDDFVIYLEFEEKQQMIYKHAIMSIRPIKHLEVKL